MYKAQKLSGIQGILHTMQAPTLTPAFLMTDDDIALTSTNRMCSLH